MAEKKIIKNNAANNAAKEKKQKINEKIFSLFDSIRAGITVVDKTGKIIFVNNKAVELWGYPKEETKGRRFETLKAYDSENMGKTLAAFTKRVTGAENPVYEIETKKKDGTISTTEVQGSPLIIDGEVAGVITTLFDITKRKKNEEELKRRNEELENFYKIAMGRELKIEELKKKVAELEEKLKAKQTEN
jgi:PAS domain S-box-containing protein